MRNGHQFRRAMRHRWRSARVQVPCRTMASRKPADGCRPDGAGTCEATARRTASHGERMSACWMQASWRRFAGPERHREDPNFGDMWAPNLTLLMATTAMRPRQGDPSRAAKGQARFWFMPAETFNTSPTPTSLGALIAKTVKPQQADAADPRGPTSTRWSTGQAAPQVMAFRSESAPILASSTRWRTCDACANVITAICRDHTLQSEPRH